jgi:TPR repeat protein
MVRPDFSRWNQTADDLLRLSREAKHPRSRERYLALYAIGSGQNNATQWAKATAPKGYPENETVMGWIHHYNASGPEAVAYRHSGGCPPFLAKR